MLYQLQTWSSILKTPRVFFKIRSKVVVTGLSKKEQKIVFNGMEGRVISQIDSDHYSVSLTNLTEPQKVHASNLQPATKVVREEDICICGNPGDLFCTRCNMMWYCSKDCQKANHKRHKLVCKAMASKFGFFDAIYKEDSIKMDDDSWSEESGNS